MTASAVGRSPSHVRTPRGSTTTMPVIKRSEGNRESPPSRMYRKMSLRNSMDTKTWTARRGQSEVGSERNTTIVANRNTAKYQG